MRIAFVIQRYGPEVVGGAELHCRWLAERLAARHDVEVFTTTSLGYIDWENHFPPGQTRIHGVSVTRFPVDRTRDQRRFSLVSDEVFFEDHGRDDELRWVVENGPVCPKLVAALEGRPDVDVFVFYSYRYYQTFFGLPAVADRAVLVPTAEEDPAIRLGVFGEFFTRPRGLVYLTPEERELIESVSAVKQTPSVVIGSGIEVSDAWKEVDARERFDLPADYLLYVGRIDRNKGVDRLLRYHDWLVEEWPDAPPLVLVGQAALEIPERAKLLHLGVVGEAEKHALMAAARVVLLPSPYESLSLSVLEAWSLGRPVLVNGGCAVLQGQCLRSNGGLFYADFAEFAAGLRALWERPDLGETLGRQGRAYVEREYSWDVVESRLEGFLSGLVRSPKPVKT